MQKTGETKEPTEETCKHSEQTEKQPVERNNHQKKLPTQQINKSTTKQFQLTLTVFAHFYSRLSKRRCPGWTRNAFILGLLILVVVFCACLATSSVEEVSMRTID